jgi:hypothetical protein
MTAATHMHTIIEELLEAMFSVESVTRLYNEYQLALPVWVNTCGGRLEYLHRSPCESQEVTKSEPSARGYNWVTLFLGDINTGTWPSRLGESQMRQ